MTDDTDDSASTAPTATQQAPLPVFRETIMYHPSGSMHPTVTSGDWIVVEPITEPLEPGLVVFNRPATQPGDGQALFKRIVAVGGQKVELRDGEVLVDGAVLVEPYVNEQGVTNPLVQGVIQGCAEESTPELCVVPSGFVFVLGDNRGASTDSRRFGPVANETVTGIVTGVIRGDRSETNGEWILRNAGIGMEPTAKHDDFLVADVFHDGILVQNPPPETFALADLVVFNRPEDVPSDGLFLFKRIVATGGQTIELLDGAVWVDGERVNEPYLEQQDRTFPLLTTPGASIPGCLEGAAADVCTVPPGFSFVLGDNREGSTDSRRYGPIPSDSIVAIVTDVLPPEVAEEVR